MPNNRRGLGYIGLPGQVLVQRPNLDAEMDWETPAAPLVAPDTPWTVNHNANFFQLTNLAALVMNTTETLTTPRMDFIQVDPTISVTSNVVGSLHFFEISPSVSVSAAMSLVSTYSEGLSISGDGVSAITNVFGTASNVSLNSTNPVTNATGLQTTVDLNGSGVATNATGVLSAITTQTGSIGTSVNFDGSATQLLATWTTAIGLRLASMQATTNIGIQISGLQGTTNIGAEIANPVSISTTGTVAAPAASTVLDLQGTSGALLVPRMSTAQKNALTPSDGMIVYDTTIPAMQGRVNGAWITL